MGFDAYAAYAEIMGIDKGVSPANPATRATAELSHFQKPKGNMPDNPVLVGTVNNKGKHLGKVAMQKITLCQYIEHGASSRKDLIAKTGWGHTVTTKVLNTLIRSGHVAESERGVLSLNNITYQLIDRLIAGGHLIVEKP